LKNSVTEDAIKNSATKKVPENSLLIVSRVGVGKFAVCRHEVCTSQDFTSFTPENCSIDFIAYQLYKNKNRLINLGQGTTIKGFTTGDLASFKLHIPEKDEQQKIADFLTSVDTKISQQTEKHRLLKDYKKGVMQQIFSQQIHFKDDDGNAFPEWEASRLGLLGSFLGGGTPSTENSAYWDGDIPWVSSSDIQDDKLFKISVSRYINSNAVKDSATKMVPRNSLLIVSRVGIGKFAVTRQDICTSQDFTNFTPHTADVVFMAYSLAHNKNKLLSIGQGTTIKGFTISDLSLLKLVVPSLKEQQKIAQFLQSLDKKIDAVNEQIEQTKLFKKGLLQQMFV
jgi:type I restriction enzyme S subunit